MLKETKCFFFSLFKILSTLKDKLFMLYLYRVEYMVIVMSNRIYITLFCVLTLSLVLLGFSFAKESGTSDVALLDDKSSESFRVIYSDSQNINVKEDNEFDVGIINKSDLFCSYSLVLKENSAFNYDEVYYMINDMPEQKVKDGVIYLGEISPYGQDGDYKKYNVKIINREDVELEFSLDVVSNKKNTISNIVQRSNSVYVDDNGDFHYYGKEVNNYIRYNDMLYRIVGVFDGEVRIISDAVSLGIYDNSLGNYLSLDDFLSSYDKNEKLNLDSVNEYEGWLLEDKEYWLSDLDEGNAYYTNVDIGVNTSNKNVNLYLRYVYDILDGIYIGGDGTINNPYEVSYGS